MVVVLISRWLSFGPRTQYEFALRLKGFFSQKGVHLNITARNAAIQCTPTYYHLCYMSHIILGCCHILGTIPDSVLLLRNF
ncbi:hypothetical protein SFRURICE_008284 [Spodoptera frugiperda]|nr:hypothetical protein SFRURICE_008284 [Spodoptera frugiperda]